MKTSRLLTIFLAAGCVCALSGCVPYDEWNSYQEGRANASTEPSIDTSDNMELLSDALTQVDAKIDAALSRSETDEIQSADSDLKNELEALEHRMDVYGDYLEDQNRRGELSAAEYRKLERELEDLEDRLEEAEEKLEG